MITVSVADRPLIDTLNVSVPSCSKPVASLIETVGGSSLSSMRPSASARRMVTVPPGEFVGADKRTLKVSVPS